MRRHTPNRRPADAGFSFVELLVTLAILAVLAAVAIPATLAQRSAGDETLQRQDLTAVAIEIDALLNTWNGTPPDTISITTTSSTWTAADDGASVASGPVTANATLTGTIWTDGSSALLSARTGGSSLLYRSDTGEITEAATLPNEPLGAGNGDGPPAEPATPPTAPTAPTATSPSAQTVAVSWSAVTGATGYIVRVDGAAPVTVAAGTLNATISGVPAGSRTVTLYALNGTAQSPGATTTVTVQAAAATPAGSTARPAWQSLPLSNNWVNFTEANPATANPLNDAAYTKVGGIVKVKGTIDSGTVTAGTVVATLPVGFRPDFQLNFPSVIQDAAGVIRVNTDGTIVIPHALTAGNYISLDNITFPAAGVATWTSVGAAGSGSAFANGYVSVGGNVGPARFWKDSNGLVWLGGSVRDGDGTASADNASIFTLPTTHRAWREMHLRAVGTASAARYATVGARTTDGINFKAGSPTLTNPISLDGVVLITSDARTELTWNDFNAYAGTTAWVNRDNTRFAPGSYARTAEGLVVMQGTLTAGTVGTPARIQYLPDALATLGRQVRAAVANNLHARLDIEWGQQATAIAPHGGTAATYYSLDGHVWVPGG